MSVAVWWASPRHARPWHRRFLTPPERKRADAFRRHEDRDRFSTANALLHLAAADHLGTAPTVERACRTCGEPHGRPLIDGIHVSVSHSGDLIAVALTEIAPVGVDVEQTTRNTDIEAMLPYVFTPPELEDTPHAAESFYQMWTRKESILKATGDGLRVRMSTITVADFNVVDLPVRPGYAAAVTVLAPDPFTVNEFDGATLLTAAPLHR